MVGAIMVWWDFEENHEITNSPVVGQPTNLLPEINVCRTQSSRTQAGLGRLVQQHKEQISPNYEGENSITYSCLILMQPLGADEATVAHMEAVHVPFQQLYGSLLCIKRLQSDRPKCRGMLVEAGTPKM